MTAPETVAVMHALGNARFVGGAVRNALLGMPVMDIDIAVPMPPEDTMARLKAKGLRTIETGLDHGTVTAVSGSHAFEITSLRRDVETDGRHAKVAFTDDWAQDAARRDFTINALYASVDGAIFDYATGVADLATGKVRFMGDPRVRIAEDYLRVLRLFRFHAWYGRGEIDAEGLGAAMDAKGKLKTLSAERIAKELLRLLEAQSPGPVVRVMAQSGILAELLPGDLQRSRLEQMTVLDRDRDAILRLAALLPDGDAAAHAAADRLRLSNADRARLEQALGDENLTAGVTPKDAARLLYRWGPARFRDKVLLLWAGAPGEAGPWKSLLELAQSWERPRFPLTGRDVMQAGIPEGPQVGRVLAELENGWVQGDFAASESDLRARLKVLAASA